MAIRAGAITERDVKERLLGWTGHVYRRVVRQDWRSHRALGKTLAQVRRVLAQELRWQPSEAQLHRSLSCTEVDDHQRRMPRAQRVLPQHTVMGP